MLKGILCFAFTATSAVSAGVAQNETKLIGTWEAPGGHGPIVVYRRDHTEEVWFPGFDGGKWIMMNKGTWHLDGNDIVADFKFTYRAADPGETMQVFRGRTKVVEFRQDRLICDGSPKLFIRVKPSRLQDLTNR